jgi:choline dehydrogenase
MSQLKKSSSKFSLGKSSQSTLLPDSVDFVIIGGGTAACVLAARLSANPAFHVVMLEAGTWDKNHIFSRIPAAFPKLFKSSADWNYQTEEVLDMQGRKMFWPRGKMVGGCSAMNAMINMWGSPDDFDAWAVENPGWSAKDLYPLMYRSESVADDLPEGYISVY